MSGDVNWTTVVEFLDLTFVLNETLSNIALMDSG